MLLGQDLGRRQHRGLAAAVNHAEHGAQRDHGVVRDGEVVGHIGVVGVRDADAPDRFAADVLDGLDGAVEAGAALRVGVGPGRHRMRAGRVPERRIAVRQRHGDVVRSPVHRLQPGTAPQGAHQPGQVVGQRTGRLTEDRGAARGPAPGVHQALQHGQPVLEGRCGTR